MSITYQIEKSPKAFFDYSQTTDDVRKTIKSNKEMENVNGV